MPTSERKETGEHPVQDNSQRPDVCLEKVDVLFVDLFRGHVTGSSTQEARRIVFWVLDTKSEVNQLQFSCVLVVEDVFKFKVTMSDIFGVNMLDC